jgi:hypothetical protein
MDSSQEIADLRDQLKRVTAERDLYKSCIPWAYNGTIQLIKLNACLHPNEPVAAFSYRDEAVEWARQKYGRWHDPHGFTFSVREDLVIEEVRIPKVTT